MMSAKLPAKVLGAARQVLSERNFTDNQITKLLPRLHEQLIQQPKLLEEIIDCWNGLFGNFHMSDEVQKVKNPHFKTINSTAGPPKTSPLYNHKIDITHILAEVEPDLLLMSPKKLIQRHEKVLGLGILNNLSDNWTILFNAPRGFYMQDWTDLTKKIYYIDQKVLDLLYDKKEQRELNTHPLILSAAVTESDFDHIRTRYLFALRSGYRELGFLHPVQTIRTRPTLKDLILSDDSSYLLKFAPFCSDEEFSCFSNLIKDNDLDEDDAVIFSELAELNSLRYENMMTKLEQYKTADTSPKNDIPY